MSGVNISVQSQTGKKRLENHSDSLKQTLKFRPEKRKRQPIMNFNVPSLQTFHLILLKRKKTLKRYMQNHRENVKKVFTWGMN